MRWWRAILLACMLLVPLAALAAAPSTVREVRVALSDRGTTLDLLLSRPVPYKIFTLADPHRLVIDFAEARWAASTAATRDDGGLIMRLRSGPLGRTGSRLVADCTDAPRLLAATLKPTAGSAVLTVEMAPLRRPSAPATLPSPAVRAAPPSASLPAAGDGSMASRIPLPAVRPSVPAAASLPRALPGRSAPLRTVAIDPGHGGRDPGAISRSGLYEKHVTLLASREIRSELLRLGRYRVVLTRNADRYIALRERIAIARRAGAEIFVSVHADKIDNQQVRGLSVYTLSERASDAEAAALAERENKVDVVHGLDLRGASPEVANVLIDLAQRQTMNHSARLAAILVNELRNDTLLLPRTHRFAGFAVLKAPDVPSVLIELGYLSNAADERVLRSPAGRRTLARAIARAIDGYFDRTEVAEAP